MDLLSSVICLSTPFVVLLVLCIKVYMFNVEDMLPTTVNDAVAVNVLNDTCQLKIPTYRRRGSPKSVV